MTSPRQLSLSAQPHRNQQLFSDHFLNTNLPRMKDWQMLAVDPQVKAAKARIAGLLDHFTPSSVEAQTEEDLVKPVLELLGHTFEVQAALRTPDGTKKPDYVFFKDAGARTALKGKTLDDALLKNAAFAVGDAKYWDRPLDIAIRTGTDPFNNKNPSYQIAFYMQHSGAAWGILTNGRLWRLYHKDTAHKLDRFYEVDLPSLVASDNDDAFLYFYAFFCREAFDAGAGGAHALNLQALLESSRDYARSVSDTLKVQVYDALRHIAQGFLDHPQNALATDPATLRAIYDNALIVLYRLLFILYAEARDLLPVHENAAYHDEYSLSAIKAEVKRNIDGGRALLPITKRLWQKLDDLFDIIDRGSPPLKVGTFNGGLFDPARHPFLKQFAVGDAHLQQAIDKLARAGGDFIDYRDLAERHLGTIYEGLLEYHLVPMDTPADDWTVDLLNDKGERKASGSYYTPDYIVKYIVDQAVGPALRKAVAGATSDADKLRRILEVNVLDPAMGSGHFLVEVVEYIARFIVDEGIATVNAAGEGDIAYWKRRVAQSCAYGVDLNPLAVELAKLSLWLVTVAKDRPLSFLDHHLRAGNSLVGAKLAEVQAFAAASAKRARKKIVIPENQEPLFSDAELAQAMSVAVGSMWLIEENPALTVSDVKAQEQLWAQIHSDLTRRYKRLADAMTAQHFGVPIDAALVRPLADRAAGKTGFSIPQIDNILTAADNVAEERRFLHWEIEFPEVFFDRDGQSLGERAGFDAVVGNPPYVRQEQLAPFKNYFQSVFSNVYHSNADLFVYFFIRGLDLAQPDGLLGFIASNSWLRASYATKFREYLKTQVTVDRLTDLGDNRVFTDAPDVYPAIPLIRKSAPTKLHTSLVRIFTRGEDLSNFENIVEQKQVPIIIQEQPANGWQLTSNTNKDLLLKMTGNQLLGDISFGSMYYGIKTGLNDAFVVDIDVANTWIARNSSSAVLLRPFLRGEDLRPWYQEDSRCVLITIPNGWTSSTLGPVDEETGWNFLRSKHPDIAQHLHLHIEAARSRYDKGQYWWELRACDYYDAFDTTKLLWPDIAKFPRFSIDNTGAYLGNTGYLFVTDQTWLLGYLSSRCCWYLISNTAISLGERAGIPRYRLIDQYMRRLPIPTSTKDDQNLITELATDITAFAKQRYALHSETQKRISSDLGSRDIRLNQKLTAWWDLPDFAAFRTEVKKALKADVPLRERHDWEGYLRDQQAEHARLTAEIVRLETELNAQVYRLFDLTPEEIALIETTTKYRYGEV